MSATTATTKAPSPIERAFGLSEQVLDQVATGRRGAIGAVRRFMTSTDEALPSPGDRTARPRALVDSALEMSDRLVKVEHDFVRDVVHSVGATLGGKDETK